MMDFAHALELIRQGNRVTRRSWIRPDGRFPWLFLVPGSTFPVEAERPMGKAAPELIGKTVDYLPHIDLMSPDRKCQPWHATSASLLAQDWMEVD